MRVLHWLFVGVCAAAPAVAQVSPEAMALHDRIVTFDAEIDVPFDFMEGDKDAALDTKMQIDLPKMDKGKLDGAAFVIFVPQGKRDAEQYAKARKDADAKLLAIQKMLLKYKDRIVPARTVAEAEAAAKSGKHFAMLSIVNAYPYGEDILWIEDLYKRGLRMIAFNHAGHNQWSDSNRPQERLGDKAEEHGGLSPLGKKAIGEMNRLGIIVDVSQITHNAMMQAMETSKTPVVASHVGIRAKVKNERNLTDDEMKAIAAKGGVIGIVAFNSYLRPATPAQEEDLAQLTKSYGLKVFTEAGTKLPPEKLVLFQKDMAAYRDRWPGADVKDLVDSIDYAVKLVGVDHVGVSTDMEHGGGVVGYKTVADAPALTAELMKRGYSESDIGKIWSGNFFRVWRQVERAAGK